MNYEMSYNATEMHGIYEAKDRKYGYIIQMSAHIDGDTICNEHRT